MLVHENVEDEDGMHPLTIGLVLHGYTYLSHVHTTVQCMTMFKGTSTNVVPSVYVRLTLGIVLHGHTYLSRVHTTVQCMTMFKGTVDGKKFAKGIHAVRRATFR